MTSVRTPYAGVLEILRYSRHYYAASGCVLVGVASLLWSTRVSAPIGVLLAGGALITAFWSASSLLASFYVYDYVGVTRWEWMRDWLPRAPRSWLNLHAGLDESTDKLIELFPSATHQVFDIYDAIEMTEPSIARARQFQAPDHAVATAKLDALPLADEEMEAVFLLFAAHEIRRPERRAVLFREVSRVLADSGELVLVEHLRDWRNFVAFGPGFLHFFSRQDWMRAARAAGLRVTRERSVTPLVRCFVFEKHSQ